MLSILTQCLSLTGEHGSQWLRRVGTCLFPGTCFLCASDSGADALCPDCDRELPPAPTPACPQCAQPTTHGERCGRCLHTGFAVDRCIAAFSYAPPIDTLIPALKYHQRLPLAASLGRHLASLPFERGTTHIIPMPLHPSRLCERGFNQALEIARPLARKMGLPISAALLSRSRATPAQATLPRKERLQNLRGAFECHGNLANANILLIDDVMTTGASLHECARVLKLHGARRVTALVAARAVGEDQ